MNLLEIKNLHTYFYTLGGVVKAVDGINLKINSSETLSLVGESGSGKTLTALSIIRLVPAPGKIVKGEIFFQKNGEVCENLFSLDEEKMREIRGGKVSMIFQEPFSSLNPVFSIGYQIKEVVKLHLKLKGNEILNKVKESLDLVGIPDVDRILKSYPHELSGGMRQRVMIAMALVSNPKLLIADEPTTALDVTIQAQILELISDVQSKLKLSVLLITHDLGIVREVSDKVAIMYAGKIMENGTKEDIFKNPLHPYTIGLLKSVPDINRVEKRLYTIKGSIPNPLEFPDGCRFNPRCPNVMDICKVKEPIETKTSGEHSAWCFKYGK
ncbi:MAG: ABC transporter ATP-binding protein [Candidatus Firestonebacteria bacterium]